MMYYVVLVSCVSFESQDRKKPRLRLISQSFSIQIRTTTSTEPVFGKYVPRAYWSVACSLHVQIKVVL